MVSRELVDACRRGDSRAFEEVVRLTHRQVYTQAFRLVGDPQEAEDVCQEAYLRVFGGISGFREESQFETWLYRIVANSAISHLRRRRRFGEIVTVLSGELPEPAPEKRTDVPLDQATVDRDSLSRALERLPMSLRTVVLLKDVYGLSCREIGEEIGVSEGAVKVRLHRARRRLKDILFPKEEARVDDDV